MSLQFAKPTVAGVARFIKEIAYTGRYVYGRKHWRRVRDGGEPMPQHRPIGQFAEIEAHHEGYITSEEYQENQKILEMNRKGPRHSQLGPGDAVLQGICRCRRHGRVMSVHYNNRVRDKHWGLRCQGDHLRGGDQCASIPGPAIEGVVVQAVLDHLDVSLVDEARRLWNRERREWKGAHAGIADEVRRQEEVVCRLRRKIVDADETLPHLRHMLDQEYERAARVLESLKERAANEEEVPDPFTEARWEELARLCADRMAIWTAATTTNQDRKQLVRILVERVVVEEVVPERIVLTIEWADGLPPTRLQVFRTPYYHRLMWDWHLQEVALDDVVGRLGAIGARTQQGRVWSRETVYKTLAIMASRATSAGTSDGVSIPPMRTAPRPLIRELHSMGVQPEEIAERLNASGVLTRFGRPWSGQSIRRVLRERRA
jgi:hypothetical protein